MNSIKYYVFLVVVAGSLVISLKVNAQIITNKDLTSTQLDKIQTTIQTQTLKAQTVYDNILDTQPTIQCLLYDKDQLNCIQKGEAVKYIYNSGDLAEKLPGEISRTKNSIQFTGNRMRVYSGDAFYLDGQDWKYIETGVIPTANFETIQTEKLQSYLWRSLINNPLHIYSVNAQTYYSGSEDGDVWNGNNDWATCRSAATGGDVSSIQLRIQTTHPSTYQIIRAFLPFDTSALSDTATIASSSLYVKTNDTVSGTAYGNIWQGTQATTLSTADFDAFSGSAASTEKLMGTAELFYYFKINNTTLPINLTGTTKIAMREKKDYDDSAPTSNTYAFMYGSETNGTDKDPYLEIELEEAEPACPDATCNGEETCASCPDDCGECENPIATPTPLTCYPDANNNLSIITSCAYASTTLGITFTNYHIPAMVWWIIAFLFIWISDFFLREFIIRWRKKL